VLGAQAHDCPERGHPGCGLADLRFPHGGAAARRPARSAQLARHRPDGRRGPRHRGEGIARDAPDLAVNRGDLVILCSQVLWVAYSLFSRASASALPPVWVMAGANVVSALVLIPLAAAVEPWRSPRAASLGWAVILYGAVLVTLAHVWYYAIVRTLGPGRAAGFLNLMPFVVLGLAWLLV